MDFRFLICTFIVSACLGLIIIPILKRLKVGQMERDDGPASHLKKQGTPTMGGVIIIIAIFIMVMIQFIALIAFDNKIAMKLLPLLLI